VYATGQIDKEGEEELWIEEGAAVIGDFIANAENADV
jgi:hypothetical protein